MISRLKQENPLTSSALEELSSLYWSRFELDSGAGRLQNEEESHE
jgi:hypothetical protein